MKKTITVEKPATSVEVSTYFCDFSNEEISSVPKYGTGSSTDATIELSYSHWGEGGEYLIADICESCFLEKLVPLMEKEFGVKFREEYW